ncbi:DUF547 domain-containing protein [Rubellicoccus peritrichatus]|uniref:DUF547 domain-containing protein n=1 Tax=Rubellicoccus peritrichatus TaxID=3080537 RepID=A0AAQ3QRX4_9BACT|nr:DUF547 domain-containing protein [Puniceicoccus sp. CR14]WOO39736.1 DUF547 domain-containing protein [Puniceicoccus sp. CR14]
MFPFRLYFAILFCSVTAWANSVDYSEYDRLLKAYVDEDGVRYQAWHDNEADVEALNTFLEEAAKVDVPSLSKEEQKAFYINLYNAAMLQIVLEKYPLKSVKYIGLMPFSIFKKERIPQGDQLLSLDMIEKGILLKEYFDPRIHFAVNCASESCPPLRNEPFVGEKLEQQLDEQTRKFANSRHAARTNKRYRKTAYSELFKWYQDDFPVSNPAEYLNQYREKPLDPSFGVLWIRYDWSLNESNKH